MREARPSSHWRASAGGVLSSSHQSAPHRGGRDAKKDTMTDSTPTPAQEPRHPGDPVYDRDATGAAVPVDSDHTLRNDVMEREQAEFGGMKFGSAFFGWLTATGTA